MKFVPSLIPLAAVAAVWLAAPALAQTATPHLDQRQDHQAQRIEQGSASGQLTAHEVQRLYNGQAHVQQMEDKAAADGKITPKERARLHVAAERQSRQIARQKHDRQHDLNHDGVNDHRAHRQASPN